MTEPLYIPVVRKQTTATAYRASEYAQVFNAEGLGHNVNPGDWVIQNPSLGLTEVLTDAQFHDFYTDNSQSTQEPRMKVEAVLAAEQGILNE